MPAKAQTEPAVTSEFSCYVGYDSFSPSKETQTLRTESPSPARRKNRPHTDTPGPIKCRTGKKIPADADHWSERAKQQQCRKIQKLCPSRQTKILSLAQRLGNEDRQHGDKQHRKIIEIPQQAFCIRVINGKLD